MQGLKSYSFIFLQVNQKKHKSGKFRDIDGNIKCPIEKYETNEEGSAQCKFSNMAKETIFKYNTPDFVKKFLVLRHLTNIFLGLHQN